MIRTAYLESAEYFAGVVDKIDIDGWEAPALGEWTVRDFAGHTYRSLTSVLSYSAALAERVDMESPVDFITAALDGGDPKLVAERGRAAGLEIIDSPQMMVRGFLNMVRSKLDELADDAVLKTPLGGIRLIDYLPVRTMELVVHTLDLTRATGIEAQPPESAMKVALDVLASVAVRRGLGPSLALAATGRAPLPAGFTLLG